MHSIYFVTILCILDFVSVVGGCYLHYCLYRSMQRTDFRMLNKTNIIDSLLKCYSVIAPIAISCGVIYGNIALFDLYPENVNPWFLSHEPLYMSIVLSISCYVFSVCCYPEIYMHCALRQDNCVWNGKTQAYVPITTHIDTYYDRRRSCGIYR